MNYLCLFVFVQILLEAFPVSSSGHFLLLSCYLEKYFNYSLTLPNFFDHFLHGPTVLVLALLFWPNWYQSARRLLSGLFCPKIFKKDSYQNLLKIFYKIFTLIFITSSLTSIFWLIKQKLENIFDFTSLIVLLFGFSLTSILLISLVFLKNNSKKIFDYKKAIILGLVQGCALLIPGLSRFATVYVTSRWLGIKPVRAFQITFLIEFPLIFSGFLLGFIKLIKTENWISLFDFKVNLAFLLSTILSFFALKFMQKLAIENKFYKIAFYMVLPILATIFLLFR